jgi:hypothetical protein
VLSTRFIGYYAQWLVYEARDVLSHGWLSDLPMMAILGISFAAANLFINSGPGRWIEETSAELAVRIWQKIRHHVLPGLFEIVVASFKKMLEWMERSIYTVDEQLRLRSGDNKFAFGLKLFLNMPWSICTYLIRIYINLLVEPQVNPIKHFPVVTVSHKMMIPALGTLNSLFKAAFIPVFGTVVGSTIALTTVGLLPGIFGFLVWEFKSNWRLYSANRGYGFKTEHMGDHSETMLRFMKPGFHSGTLPVLYKKLRKAEARDSHSKRIKFEDGLHHVEDAIKRFTQRTLFQTLGMAPNPSLWNCKVQSVRLSSQRISVEIIRRAGDVPFEVAFEEKSGLLVAAVLQNGWVESLNPDALGWFLGGLVGYYKLAGVDLVREHIEERLEIHQPYDIRRGHIILWMPRSNRCESIMDLTNEKARFLRSQTKGDVVMRDQLFYSCQTLCWSDWVVFWNAQRPGSSLIEQRLLRLPTAHSPASA